MTDVDISIRIEAPPATVFRYFIDPNRMIEWIGVSADLEPHPGGVSGPTGKAEHYKKDPGLAVPQVSIGTRR